jgi:hypothetical protein
MNNLNWPPWLGVLLCWLAACSTVPPPAEYPASPEGAGAYGAVGEAPQDYSMRSSAPAAPVPAPVSAGADEGLAEMPAPPPPPALGPALPPQDGAGETVPDPVAGKGVHLIYSAQLALATRDAEARVKATVELARKEGGYLVHQQATTVIVRVPSARFYAVLEALEKLGQVTARNIDVEDVSEQYYDLETRVRSTEALQLRLIELLQRANSVEDALAIEEQLGRVSEQLELLKGKLRRLSELVAFSTIETQWLPLAEEQVGAAPGLPFDWLSTLGLGQLLELPPQ